MLGEEVFTGWLFSENRDKQNAQLAEEFYKCESLRFLKQSPEPMSCRRRFIGNRNAAKLRLDLEIGLEHHG